MKERPILFTGPMVRAILEGRKTVTRRPVKGGQIPAEDTTIQEGGPRWSAIGQRHPRYGYCVFGETEAECAQELAEHGVCPYGQPGDRLWVRETWAHVGTGDPGHLVYRATYPRCLPPGLENVPADIRDEGYRWRPSIHMPRWACRILLEITAVRVERLHDLSDPGALAEGVSHSEMHSGDSLVDVFARLWESTGGDWDANPWVWVVEFKRVTP
ncbi:hypothetical protein [Pseudomonas aeruginosa]|uniref:hypothetical protein n=1 Tax=Pseudomonas aeruginosa TaxID=287 RepID=UPI001ECE986D|nr:hypothetical protein [Pseudomonas aeruginosa]MBX6043985.1 hypothetical protein [Pseudomonas aeruginosa]MCS7700714.1 hypothetical protein [Pseudomonas aeruginosa]MDV2244097.1 hypothetical protein [Pseudomonas aeruginosa]